MDARDHNTFRVVYDLAKFRNELFVKCAPRKSDEVFLSMEHIQITDEFGDRFQSIN